LRFPTCRMTVASTVAKIRSTCFRNFPRLRSLQIFRRKPLVPLPETDPFRSALAFRALVAQPRVEVEHLFRYVIEQVVIVAVAPEALILPVGNFANERVLPLRAEDARRGLAARDFSGLRIAVAELLGKIDGRLWVASALRWLDAVLAAPLPNVTWASSIMNSVLSLSGAAHRYRRKNSTAEIRAAER
jgi:two-component system chemotaxis sensor kinase CheA